MSSQKTPPDDRHEPSLEDMLHTLEKQWQEQSHPHPPGSLDLQILRKARMDLDQEPPKKKRAWPWTRGWTHNMATAAVVVLAVTVLFQLREGTQELEAVPDMSELRQSEDPLSTPAAGGMPTGAEGNAGTSADPGSNADNRPDAALLEAPARLRSASPVATEDAVQPGSQNSLKSAKTEAITGDTSGSGVQAAEGENQPSGKPAFRRETLESEAAEVHATQSPTLKDPEQWLASLEALHEQAQWEELARELEAFKQAYPQIPVPDHLER